MHDGASCHWPEISSDLKPIENSWKIVKNRVAETTQVKEAWTKEISIDYCNNLILRLSCHIQAVIKSKKGHTKC